MPTTKITFLLHTHTHIRRSCTCIPKVMFLLLFFSFSLALCSLMLFLRIHIPNQLINCRLPLCGSKRLQIVLCLLLNDLFPGLLGYCAFVLCVVLCARMWMRCTPVCIYHFQSTAEQFVTINYSESTRYDDFKSCCWNFFHVFFCLPLFFFVRCRLCYSVFLYIHGMVHSSHMFSISFVDVVFCSD